MLIGSFLTSSLSSTKETEATFFLLEYIKVKFEFYNIKLDN